MRSGGSHPPAATSRAATMPSESQRARPFPPPSRARDGAYAVEARRASPPSMRSAPVEPATGSSRREKSCRPSAADSWVAQTTRATPPRFTASPGSHSQFEGEPGASPPSRRGEPQGCPRDVPATSITQSESQDAIVRPLPPIPATGAVAPLQFASVGAPPSITCAPSHRPGTGVGVGGVVGPESPQAVAARQSRAATAARPREEVDRPRLAPLTSPPYRVRITMTGPHAVSRMLPMA